MRKKSISKIIAIALTAMMTTCLTACEDKRDIPVYGTGIESEADTSVHHRLSPTAPVETEPVTEYNADAYIKSVNTGYDEQYGEYIAVCVVITNNLSEKIEACKLAQVKVFNDLELSLIEITDNIIGDEYEDKFAEIKPGEQSLMIQKFQLSEMDVASSFIDVNVTVWDNAIQDNVVVDSRRYYLTEE